MNHLLRSALTFFALLALVSSASAQTGLTRLGEFKVNSTVSESIVA